MINLMKLENDVFKFNKKLDDLCFSLLESDTLKDWKSAKIIFNNKVKTEFKDGEAKLLVKSKEELKELNDTLKGVYRAFVNFINDEYLLHWILF